MEFVRAFPSGNTLESKSFRNIEQSLCNSA